MPEIQVRTLTEADWRDWKTLRLEAIRLHPDAFGGAYEEESLYSDERIKKSLLNNTIFGAYDAEDLIGVAGFYPGSSLKTTHKGFLFTMYVRAAYRGTGIAEKLLQAVIAHAKLHAEQLHCTVAAHNPAAIRLYEKNGFTIYGTEKRALKVGDVYYDEHLMVLPLS